MRAFLAALLLCLGVVAPAARAQETAVEGLLPDQAHAMADVGYHFANLWFAAD